MSQIIIANQQQWLNYFSPLDAYTAVFAHVAALPSSQTDEKYTAKVYRAGLQDFMEWIGNELPTPDRVRGYIAHLIGRGLKASTISSKYLAPTRHYLKRLADQHITGLTGSERDFVSDCRESIRQAAALPTPKSQTTTNVAPLWNPQFTRLTIKEVNIVLKDIERTTIAGLRDYAMLHLAFSTGLRLAEIARITPSSLQPIEDSDDYIVTVRGKRSNVDPVPLSKKAFADITAYIAAYNADLCADDPRRITGDVPVWQPIHQNKYHFALGRNDPCKGMSHQGIRDLIAKRTLSSLGKAIAPHDMRRTAAAIASRAGMPLSDIQQLLRHKDAAVTMHYVGTEPKFHERSLSKYVEFG